MPVWLIERLPYYVGAGCSHSNVSQITAATQQQVPVNDLSSMSYGFSS